MNVNRDKNILSHIVQYCEQIEETVALFGADYDIFCANNTFRNAWGQSELDDNALEQAAGGKSSLELGEEAWKKVKNIIYGADNSQ